MGSAGARRASLDPATTGRAEANGGGSLLVISGTGGPAHRGGRGRGGGTGREGPELCGKTQGVSRTNSSEGHRYGSALHSPEWVPKAACKDTQLPLSLLQTRVAPGGTCSASSGLFSHDFRTGFSFLRVDSHNAPFHSPPLSGCSRSSSAVLCIVKIMTLQERKKETTVLGGMEKEARGEKALETPRRATVSGQGEIELQQRAEAGAQSIFWRQ